jgi:hypothetical protein
MPDAFASHQMHLDSPGNNAAAVTPHDTNELATFARALYIGSGGDVSIISPGDTTPVLYRNLQAGTIHPVRAKIVRATGTTATNIVAIW